MPEVELNENTVVGTSDISLEGNPKEGLSLTEENEPKEEWLDVLGSGDLKIKTLVEGESGNRPQTGDICTVNVIAELENGTVVEQEHELQVELGASEVVQGLDLVFSLLDVGQKVTAVIKSRFAYGKMGLKPKIPPDATIIYTVELLKIDDAPEISNMSFDDRKKRATFKKDKGNWWFSRDDAQKAIQCYRSALNIVQESTSYTDADNQVTEMPEEVFRQFVQTKLVIYNNLAAAQILIGAFDSALVSAEHVIQLEPNNVKALYRKGKILAAQGKCDEAVEIFKKAINLDPENNAVKKELASSIRRQALEKEQAKSLYKKMLGSTNADQSDEPSNLPTPTGMSAITKLLSGAAAATLVAGLAYGLSFKYKTFSLFD